MVSFGRRRQLSLTDLTGYGLYAVGVCLHAFRATRWIAPLFLIIACKRILRSKRSRAERADVLLARDQRRPVLYLRSFSDDESTASGSEHERGLMLKTTEELLALAFARVGPFVCVGRPGEEMPELGAARLYCPSEDWQASVRKLIERARLIVLHLGSTPGFWWEVEQAVTTVELRQLLFFVPPGGGPMYERLTAYLKARSGIYLPAVRRAQELAQIGEKRPEALFLYFDAEGRPAMQPVWPGLMEPGLYSDRAVMQALASVFVALGLGTPRLPLHPYVKWAALLLLSALPALLLNYFLSVRPTLADKYEKVAMSRARLEVLGLHISLLRAQRKTGQLPRTEDWVEWLAAQGAMMDEMRQRYVNTGKLADPWGFPYRYRYPARRNADSFDVYSLGADGKEGGTGANEDIWNVGPSFDAYKRR